MSQEKIFQVGGIELRVSNRVFGDDGGPAIRVFGQVEGNTVQLLRFDCFRKKHTTTTIRLVKTCTPNWTQNLIQSAGLSSN